MLFQLSVQEILFLVPILIMSLSLHEVCHGWASSLQGDPTPRLEGRLTLNPLKHMDLWGTLMLLTVGFGWAKPVRIDIDRYQHKYRGLVITSLAGPFANMLIAVVFTYFLRFILLQDSLVFLRTESVINVIRYVLIINILLFVFNLIPIPPLDGSRVITALFHGQKKFVVPYNKYGAYVLLGILLSSRFLDREILPISRMMSAVFSIMISLIIPEASG